MQITRVAVSEDGKLLCWSGGVLDQSVSSVAEASCVVIASVVGAPRFGMLPEKAKYLVFEN